MRIIVTPDRDQMGYWVAEQASLALRDAINLRGEANLLIATGSSQFEVLSSLAASVDVPWDKVTGFHLDEYIGLSPDHAASFCGYLKSRFIDRVPLKHFYVLRGDGDANETMRIVGDELLSHRIDVALVGIGENGHLAFNDPPADFETTSPYHAVELDEACRRQQVGEGWFDSLEAVPTHAMSMSIRQILNSAKIFCSVPDERKALAVQRSVEGSVTPDVPASILQTHRDVTLVIDRAAASLLSTKTLSAAEKL